MSKWPGCPVIACKNDLCALGCQHFKPRFIRWTDWILDGDAVTYGYDWPSASRWIVPGTYNA